MEIKNKKFALLGEKLSHSYSKKIHSMLMPYEYELCPVAPDKLGEIIMNSSYSGFNVTIPYKTQVMPFCDRISANAARIGSVNTLLKTKDGLYGYNTDSFGFSFMADNAGISFENRKILILGTGGTSKTVYCVVTDSGASGVKFVSRSGEINYTNVYDVAADSEIIINTTPVGMYPDTGDSLLDLSKFPRLCGVIDVIYNPLRTALLLQAKDMGIPYSDGFPMLVAQAKASAEIFSEEKICDSEIQRIHCALRCDTENIVLIGMPGCGKTTLGQFIAKTLAKDFFDTDAEIEKKERMSVSEIFALHGEEYFRNVEAEIINAFGKKSGAVIATGGGAVLSEDNMNVLRQNGHIVYITRDTSSLSLHERPLSTDVCAVEKIAAERLPIYQKYADTTISNNGTLKELFDIIQKHFEKFNMKL